MTVENVLIIPDTHFPDTDMRVWKTILRIIAAEKPDRIVHIGDLMDYPQPSRWTKGTKSEFEGSVYEASKNAVKKIIEPLREVFDGPIGVHEGNHDLRPRAYMEKYAPALADTDYFNFEKLLRFDEFEIERLPDFHTVAPGWITTHGHLGGIRLNPNAGMTALKAAERLGVNVVMGHTHRAGICNLTRGREGVADVTTGMEVGHIMDPKKVTYLKGATGNWQQGVGWLTIDGKHVVPKFLPVSARKMSVHEKVYAV